MSWRKLWKYVFPPVNIKFSVFSVVLGYVAALAYGYSGKWLPWGQNVPGWLVFLIIAITDFIVEGMWQHGNDILYDKSGGLSGFREEGPLAERIARYMVWFSFVWGIAVTAFLIYAGRIAAVLVGWPAVYLAYKYAKKRNECFSFYAVMMAVLGGWLSVTNYIAPEALTVMLIGGMTSRLSLAFYRYDDYKGLNTIPDFKDDMELLVYYRNLFWLILWLPWLSAMSLAYFIVNKWIPFILTLPVIAELYQKRRYWCHTSNH